MPRLTSNENHRTNDAIRRPLMRTVARLAAPFRAWSDTTPARGRLYGRRLRLELLEDRALLSVTDITSATLETSSFFDPTAQEQELLELVNRMRIDPQGELDRLFISLTPSEAEARDPDVDLDFQYYWPPKPLETLILDWATLESTAPLNWNWNLYVAAEGHNDNMIRTDTQSHQVLGEYPLGTRLEMAGYTDFTEAGENIFGYAKSPLHAFASFAIDWNVSDHGHRDNLMDPLFSEVGISYIPESSSTTRLGPNVVTVDFGGGGTSIGPASIVGVVFDDSNGNSSYNAGEGASGVTITVTGVGGDATTASLTAGGYQIQVPDGIYTVTASGGAFERPITYYGVEVAGANVKVDFNLQDRPNYYAPGLDLNGPLSIGADYYATYVEQGGPISIVSELAMLNELDGDAVQWVRATVTGPTDHMHELLEADPLDTNITVIYDASSAVLTLAGYDSAENYQRVLRTLTYDNLADLPTLGLRTIELTASDGQLESELVTSSIELLPEIVPELTVHDAMVDEGDGDPASVTFTIELSEASTRPISLHYATVDGTAIADVNYEAADSTIVIPAGTTELAIVVPVIGNRLEEDDLTFFLDLQTVTTPLLATLNNTTAEATIIDDDQPLDLGRLSTFSQNNLELTDRRGLFRFTARENGIYGIVAQYLPDPAGGQEIPQIAIYNAPWDGVAPPIAISEPSGDDSLKLTIELTADQTYLIEMIGPTADMDWQLGSPIRRDPIDPQNIQLPGTPDDDIFRFRLGATPSLFWGGIWVPVDLSTLDSLEFLGLAGYDTVTIDATDSADLITINPVDGTVRIGDTLLNISDTDRVVIESGGGNDQLTITGTPNDELLIANNRSVSYLAGDIAYQINDIELVTAIAGSGGNDLLRLLDTPGNDRFTSYADRSSLISDLFSVNTQGYDVVSIDATGGGFDSLYAYDSAYDDQLIQKNDSVTISTSGGELLDDIARFRQFVGFESIVVFATGGGRNTAQITDSAGNDLLSVREDRTLLRNQSRSRLLDLRSFDHVAVDSVYGGTDQLHFSLPTLDDDPALTIVQSTKMVELARDGSPIMTARHFDQVMVNGVDLANEKSTEPPITVDPDDGQMPPLPISTMVSIDLQSFSGSSSPETDPEQTTDSALAQLALVWTPAIDPQPSQQQLPITPDSDSLSAPIDASDVNDQAIATSDWDPTDEPWDNWQSPL